MGMHPPRQRHGYRPIAYLYGSADRADRIRKSIMSTTKPALTIIKPGKLPVETILQGTCRNCCCEVECPPSAANGCRGPGDSVPNYSVICPTMGCGWTITLDSKRTGT